MTDGLMSLRATEGSVAISLPGRESPTISGGIIPLMSEKTWRNALARTRQTAFGRLASLLGASELTQDYWETLEATLLQADLGLGVTMGLIEELRTAAAQNGWTQARQLRAALQQALLKRLPASVEPTPDRLSVPFVTLVVGVNGSGKTTTAARLAARWKAQGHRVLLAGADTYRAAAAEQLQKWGQALAVPVIVGQPGSDPAAVIYDACQAAAARKIDAVIGDTSGRMHTDHNLMAELEKIRRVAGKAIPGAPHEVLLVLDATTGQNAISQARSFTQSVGVTGVVLAKLDSSARGGVALAVAQELKLPIRYVGLGEGARDLAPFDPHAYLAGLLDGLQPESAGSPAFR